MFLADNAILTMPRAAPEVFKHKAVRHNVQGIGCASRAPERNVIMMHKIFAASCLAGIIIAGAAAAPAYAGGGNPSGTGPPNQTCQNTANSSNQLTTPGKSGSSPGSVFNEGSPYTPGPQGTGGAAYNAAGAPSQYDVACFKNKSGGLSPGSASASMAPTTAAPTPANTGHTPHHG